MIYDIENVMINDIVHSTQYVLSLRKYFIFMQLINKEFLFTFNKKKLTFTRQTRA